MILEMRYMPTNWYQYISVIHHELAESRIRCGMEKLEEVQEPVEWQQGQHPHLGSVLTRAPNKGYPISEGLRRFHNHGYWGLLLVENTY